MIIIVADTFLESNKNNFICIVPVSVNETRFFCEMLEKENQCINMTRVKNLEKHFSYLHFISLKIHFINTFYTERN